MRVLLISFAVLLIAGMAALGARIWGLSMPHVPYEHAFLNTDGPFVVVQVTSLDDARKVVGARKDVILWLDAKPEEDGGFPLIAEVMSAFSKQRFILNVANETEVDLHLIAALEKLSPEDRVLIQSDAASVISSVKRRQPLWLYGTSWPDLMRLLSFESVWLLPATSFPGDMFIAPLTVMGRPAFNAAVIEEMRRRKKPVLLGPLATADEVKRAAEFSPDGYILSDLSLLASLP